MRPREGSPAKAGAILGIKISACGPQWAPKSSPDRQVATPLASLSTSPPKISTRRGSKHTGSDFAPVSRSTTVKRVVPAGVPNKRYSSLPRQKTRGLHSGGIPSTRRVQSAQLLDDVNQRGELRARLSFALNNPDSSNKFSSSKVQDSGDKNADTEAQVTEDQPGGTELRAENSPPTHLDIESSQVAEGPLTPSNHHVRSEPSVHLYDMRISQRLASRSLIPSHSLPHLSDGNHKYGHKRGQSSVSNFSVYSTKAERRRQTSSTGFASAKVPGSWGNVVKDGASSIYPSQDNSLPSTSSSSLNRLGHIFNHSQANGYEIIASELARDLMPHDEPHTAMDSSALRRRTIGSPDDVKEPARLERSSIPKISKLKEETETPARDLLYHDRRSLQRLNGDKSLGMQLNSLNGIGTLAPFDGSAEKRLSGWKLDLGDVQVLKNPISRQGSTYGTSPKTNDEDAAAVWERALRNHASQETVRSGPRNSIYSYRNTSTNRSLNQRSISQESVFTNGAGVPSSTSEVMAHFNRVDYGISSARATSSPRAVSWSRFPSHTRHERTSSAGESDKVVPRDFALETGTHGDAGKAEIEKGHLIDSKKKKKSRSMTFGKNMFKSWGRLYKSQSADFRRYGAGHRSSITTGGILEYPELEILPPVLDPSTSWKSQGASSSEPSQHGEKIVNSDSAYSERDNSGIRAETPSGARVWSQLYASCVELPSDTEPNASADMGSLEQQAMLLSSGWLPSHLRHSSTNSGSDLRRPTRDFEELLKAGEIKERDNLLKAAEEAWGN